MGGYTYITERIAPQLDCFPLTIHRRKTRNVPSKTRFIPRGCQAKKHDRPSWQDIGFFLKVPSCSSVDLWSVQFSPLTDWIVRGTWRMISRDPLSGGFFFFFFYRLIYDQACEKSTFEICRNMAMSTAIFFCFFKSKRVDCWRSKKKIFFF